LLLENEELFEVNRILIEKLSKVEFEYIKLEYIQIETINKKYNEDNNYNNDWKYS